MMVERRTAYGSTERSASRTVSSAVEFRLANEGLVHGSHLVLGHYERTIRIVPDAAAMPIDEREFPFILDNYTDALW